MKYVDNEMYNCILIYRLFICLAFMLITGHTYAQEIRVAVASNFKLAITSVAEKFNKNSEHQVTLVFGSTGKHYAQIKNGAPYDVFFAADARRPKLLVEEGVALAGSRFTYAVGKIILWSPKKEYIDPDANVLKNGRFRFLALANPKLAPYGKAAMEVLVNLNIWGDMNRKIVRGENIGQTFQFIKSGNAELGFVAYSQLIILKQDIQGSYWKIPQSLYAPIEQQAVILKDSKAAREFISFVRSRGALKIIRDHGYTTP